MEEAKYEDPQERIFLRLVSNTAVKSWQETPHQPHRGELPSEKNPLPKISQVEPLFTPSSSLCPTRPYL